MMARNRSELKARRRAQQPLLAALRRPRALWSVVALAALAACSKPPSASVEAASGEPAPAAAEAKASEPAAAAATAAQPAAAAGPAQLGAPAPDFTLRDLAGNSLSLSQHRGKKVLIHFFATWCGVCRAELPSLRGLSQNLGPNETLLFQVELIKVG